MRLKFQSQPELARCLAPLLADTIKAAVALNNLTLPELLLPVPLSPQRLRERGYNQAWVIAQALARQLSLAATATALVRSRDTPHQVGLTRSAREANLRDGLWVEPALKAHIDGRRVALIDDVMTTGATAHAAAQALRQAGAAEVQVWVLARTPREA